MVKLNATNKYKSFFKSQYFLDSLEDVDENQVIVGVDKFVVQFKSRIPKDHKVWCVLLDNFKGMCRIKMLRRT